MPAFTTGREGDRNSNACDLDIDTDIEKNRVDGGKSGSRRLLVVGVAKVGLAMPHVSFMQASGRMERTR
ncbi:MAG: hypothetical protein OXC08_19910 [Thiotrichales bacterium]|nr:hypothetical protein [Thiotrichales bacterium]